MDVILTADEIIIRILLSAFIGFIIGFNREKHSAAGVRTHMILAIGVCVITLVQVDMTAETILWNIEHPDYLGAVSSDIGRLTAQIVSGIGFLGSGLILVRNERTVDGMTSAVSLWTVASISIAVGYGEYLVSLLATVFLIITLTTMNFKSTRFGLVNLKVAFRRTEINRDLLNQFLEEFDGKIVNYTMANKKDQQDTEYHYSFEIEYRGFIDRIQFIDRFIEQFDDIIFIELI
ncbi:MgtC/SapB family protein [Aerococcaceae bacterium DSM 111020]|nr:MgtC/SapB family protein [Aerococcaceae bacterium DSM 111020]